MSETRAIPQDMARIFSGSSNPRLAAGIADYIGLPLSPCEISRFSNDDLRVHLGAPVRGRVVFIVQSLSPPVSDCLMEALMMCDIARSAAAREVHLIMPYFSYARSDKKDAPRISITARLVADLIRTAGATHLMTMTLHSPQIHGFFSIPADPLTARPLFVRHFRAMSLSPNETVVVSPDLGRAKSTARFASELGLRVVAADKVRVSDREVVIRGLSGEHIRGFRHALIYDDEIATGGSVVEISKLLVAGGVERISVVCTHGLFTENAAQRLADIPQIREVVCTDTVSIPASRLPAGTTMLSVAPLFGEAILRNYRRESLSDLFACAD